MLSNRESGLSLQQRVDDYLVKYSHRPNSFVLAAEAAKAEADMNEYLLKRAEKDLEEAQSRVDEIKHKIKELRSAT